jgi:hypothetical protein
MNYQPGFCDMLGFTAISLLGMGNNTLLEVILLACPIAAGESVEGMLVWYSVTICCMVRT